MKKKHLMDELTNYGRNSLISEERQTILSYQICELAGKLRTGKLDPVQVLQAYQVVY